MREKNEMSWKEAKEEARRLRESNDMSWAKQDMEDEEEEQAKENALGAANQSNKVHLCLGVFRRWGFRAQPTKLIHSCYKSLKLLKNLWEPPPKFKIIILSLATSLHPCVNVQ